MFSNAIFLTFLSTSLYLAPVLFTPFRYFVLFLLLLLWYSAPNIIFRTDAKVEEVFFSRKTLMSVIWIGSGEEKQYQELGMYQEAEQALELAFVNDRL